MANQNPEKQAPPVAKRVQLLDAEKEEKRSWQANREGLDAKRLRTVDLLFCFFCNGPIGPDQLIIDRGGERACPTCGKK